MRFGGKMVHNRQVVVLDGNDSYPAGIHFLFVLVTPLLVVECQFASKVEGVLLRQDCQMGCPPHLSRTFTFFAEAVQQGSVADIIAEHHGIARLDNKQSIPVQGHAFRLVDFGQDKDFLIVKEGQGQAQGDNQYQECSHRFSFMKSGNNPE